MSIVTSGSVSDLALCELHVNNRVDASPPLSLKTKGDPVLCSKTGNPVLLSAT
jgi:hypothetical protein